MKAHYLDIKESTIENLDSLKMTSGGPEITKISDDSDLTTNSHDTLSTQKAVKAYVDAKDVQFLHFHVSDFNGVLELGVVYSCTRVIPPEMDGMILTGCIAACVQAGSGFSATQISVRRSRNDVESNMLSSPLSYESVNYSTTCTINPSNDDVQTGDIIFLSVDFRQTILPRGNAVTLTFEHP